MSIMFCVLVAIVLAGSCSAFTLKNLVTFGDSYTDITMNGDGKYSTCFHVDAGLTVHLSSWI